MAGVEARKKVVDGRAYVEVNGIGHYACERLTEHEAEQLIKELRRSIDQCRSHNRPPRKFGDH